MADFWQAISLLDIMGIFSILAVAMGMNKWVSLLGRKRDNFSVFVCVREHESWSAFLTLWFCSTALSWLAVYSLYRQRWLIWNALHRQKLTSSACCMKCMGDFSLGRVDSMGELIAFVFAISSLLSKIPLRLKIQGIAYINIWSVCIQIELVHFSALNYIFIISFSLALSVIFNVFFSMRKAQCILGLPYPWSTYAMLF